MNNNVVTVILVMLVLGLGGFLVYDKVIDKDVEKGSKEEVKVEQTKKEEVKEYTYKDLAGNYYFETDAKIASMPGAMARFWLVLDEKGTFNYQYSNGNAPSGLLGNYYIEDDKIILNYYFETNSGVGIFYKEGSKIIYIEEGKIIDKESLIHTLAGTNITLEKSINSDQNFKTFSEVVKQNL